MIILLTSSGELGEPVLLRMYLKESSRFDWR